MLWAVEVAEAEAASEAEDRCELAVVVSLAVSAADVIVSGAQAVYVEEAGIGDTLDTASEEEDLGAMSVALAACFAFEPNVKALLLTELPLLQHEIS